MYISVGMWCNFPDLTLLLLIYTYAFFLARHTTIHIPVVLFFFLVDRCRSYCVMRNVAEGNQSSSECVISTRDSNSDHISLTSDEDMIRANCCSAGTPLPFVSWEFCSSNSTSCTSLTKTNATQSVAELKVTGDDLIDGDGFIRCVAKYLDVTADVWKILLHVEKTDDGKMSICGDNANSDACFTHWEKCLVLYDT